MVELSAMFSIGAIASSSIFAGWLCAVSNFNFLFLFWIVFYFIIVLFTFPLGKLRGFFFFLILYI
jgi:hypothetical protein